jgi:hypothetical protein
MVWVMDGVSDGWCVGAVMVRWCDGVMVRWCVGVGVLVYDIPLFLGNRQHNTPECEL